MYIVTFFLAPMCIVGFPPARKTRILGASSQIPMHLVTSDRITLVPGDRRTGYRFSVAALPDSTRIADLAEEAREALSDIHDPKSRHRSYPSERELDAVREALSGDAGPTVVLGVSTAATVLAARAVYTELGYYRAESNRIYVPDDAPCRLGVHVEHLLYSLKDARRYPEASSLAPPLRDPGDSLALARALNFGVVSWVLLPEDDASAARLVGALLALDIIPLVSLASVLARRGNGGVIDVFV